MGGLPFAFSQPWLLLALGVLPLLWLLLRAMPPAPRKARFGAVSLLVGLEARNHETARTPWWILLIRLLALALVILGFAGPLLHPQQNTGSQAPLLILSDASWGSAQDWTAQNAQIRATLETAARHNRPAALIALSTQPQRPTFENASLALERLAGFTPQPLPPRFAAWQPHLPEGAFESLWFSDGLDHIGETRAELSDALRARGTLSVIEDPRPRLALHPATVEGSEITLSLSRSHPAPPQELMLNAIGPDPNGSELILASLPLRFSASDTQTTGTLTLPPELRNRLSRFAIADIRSPATVTLVGDDLQRKRIALIAESNSQEALELLSPLHYLRQALAPSAELIEAPLSTALQSQPDVIILADVARFTPQESDALWDWVDRGGLLIRFAGPRLAASDPEANGHDALLPVHLRAGGRSIGGTMTWGEPRKLSPFEAHSPFHGLAIPDDIEVRAQILAQPSPELAQRAIAQLVDGTPLVTRNLLGQGQVVLFHVTANAEWSNLPLSELFVQMLERLSTTARRSGAQQEQVVVGQQWHQIRALDGFGQLSPREDGIGVEGALLAAALAGDGPSAALPPGLYQNASQQVALNVMSAAQSLTPAIWPQGITPQPAEMTPERSFKGEALAIAMLLFSLDILATLWLRGQLHRPKTALLALFCALSVTASDPAQAEPRILSPADAQRAIAATNALRLAYVITGDARSDTLSEAGLTGLSQALTRRTTIEPAAPIGVDIERDELSFFPFLYWPISLSQPLPSPDAYERLNAYLRSGGMILFDRRDGDLMGDAQSPEAQHLQALASGLVLPPLALLPEDHVLTRTFYLLQDFPGRHDSREIWVEAPPPDATQAEGMPFRNLNDGVTPVVIGANDWAAAWAVDAQGLPMVPVGYGYAGERQREIALRFGINLIMHVLTGNYKSDQVHVPDLLQRLGD